MPGAAEPLRPESAAQLCCGTRTAGSAAPAAEPALPPRGAPAPRPPPPPAGRKRPRRGAERSTWAGRRGGRGASGAARSPRSRLQVRRPRRRRVTAPPAWPPSGLQTPRGQPAGPEEARRLGPTGEDPREPAGRGAAPGLPPPPPPRSARLASRAWRPARKASAGGHGVGWAAWTGPRWEDRLGLGLGFSVLFFFSGKFPERQVLDSGFSPLDFVPACGRLKGNQKRVSDTKTPLTQALWPGRVTIRTARPFPHPPTSEGK